MSDNPFELKNLPQTAPQIEAPAEPEENPFSMGAIERTQKSQLQATLQDAVRVPPEKAARAAQLSRKLQIYADPLSQNLADLEIQDAVMEAGKKLATSPKLAKAMREGTDFARQSHDDIEPLSKVERSITDYPRALAAGASKGVGSALTGSAELLDIGARALDTGYRAVFGDSAADALWFDNPTMGGVEIQMNPGAPLRVGGKGWTGIGEAVDIDKKNRAFDTDVASAVGQITTQIAAALATGGASMIPVGVSQAAGEMADRVKRDKAGQELTDLAVLAGAATGLLEKIPLDKILSDTPALRDGLLRWLGDKAVAGGLEATTEIAQGILMDVARIATTNPEATMDVVDNLYEGGVAGTAAALLRAAMGIRGRTKQPLEQAGKANDDATKLGELFAAAAESRLKVRNVDSFAQFVQQAADETDGAPSAVYIDARTLADTLQQAGVSEAQIAELMPTVPDQLRDALATDGVVEIPIGDIAARVAGTPLEQVLLQHMRVEPDGLSQFEATQAATEAEALFQSAASTISAQAIDIQDLQQRSEAVKTTVLDQLNTTKRFRPEVNDAYATLVRDFYAATSVRLGITPDELYARYPLRVIGAPIVAGDTPANTLNAQNEAPITLPEGVSIRELADGTGFEAVNAEGAVIGRLRDNLLRGQAEQIDENANIDIVAVDGDRKGQGIGRALYDAFDKKHGGRIAPSGKTTRDAWAVWKRNYPAKVEQFVQQEADRIAQGADPQQILAGITDPEVAQMVVERPYMQGSNATSFSVVAPAEQAEADVANSRNASRVSPRAPTGVKATEDQYGEERLQPSIEAMTRAPSVLENTARELQKYPNFTNLQGDPLSVVQQAKERMKGNLRRLMTAFPQDLSDRARMWYVGGNRIAQRFADRYGFTVEQTSLAIAALSPQKNWFENVSAAERVMDIITNHSQDPWDAGMTAVANSRGWFDDPRISQFVTAATEGRTLRDLFDPQNPDASATAMAWWVRAFDEAHNPRGLAVITPEGTFLGKQFSDNAVGRPTPLRWGSAGEIGKAIRALMSTTPEARSGIAGGAHKVRSFYNNIVAPFGGGDITVDTHAVAAALLRPLGGTTPEVQHALSGAVMAGDRALGFDSIGSNSIVGVTGSYGVYADAYREVAEEFGLLPREVQSITWEAVRLLFDKKGATLKDQTSQVWAAFNQGLISEEQAHEQIFELAGGIGRPDWADGAVDPHPFDSSYRRDSDRATGAPERQFEGDVAAQAAAAGLPNGGGVRGSAGQLESAPGADLGFDGPLADLPATVTVDGASVTFGPFAPARQAAADYMAKAGLPYAPATRYVEVDVERARRIADAFENMAHDPNDPRVKAAYDALVRETMAQWEAVKATGLVVEFITGADPYGNPRNAILDVVQNNHLWVYPTDAGFGGTESADVDISGNPLLAVVPGERIAGQPVRVNDLFRIVHDYFGHIKEGVGFRAGGEENAWRSHWAMFSPLARAALTTETRGQNSWVNFGPFAEFNKTAGPGETQYAPQKVGLLPDWAVNDGATDSTMDQVFMQSPVAPTKGIHFSKQPRVMLDGRLYGTGLKGLEAQRIEAGGDPRLAERVYFYVDEGNGIRPEAGVGGFAHEVQLPPLYDAKANSEGLWAADLNVAEQRILDAGYAGYFVRNAFNGQGAAVVIGQASRGLRATQIANPTTGYTPPPMVVPVRMSLSKDQLAALNEETLTAAAPSARIDRSFVAVRPSSLFVDPNELGAIQDQLAAAGVQAPEAALQQGPRGTFNPSTLTINLLEAADLSTFLHETGHFFLEVMADIASQPGAPVDVQKDMGDVLAWFGVTDLYEWNTRTLEQKRPYHEKFAESFERYLLDGKAPSVELNAIFGRFRSWMLSVYRSLKNFMAVNTNAQLSDEVRAVFDRMLATDEQIQLAEQMSGYEAIYKTADEAGMTPEEWADYQAKHRAGTERAIAEMQSRSIRDLKWSVNARSRAMRELQRETNDRRKAMRLEVQAEVRAMPVYAAMRWLKTGKLPDGVTSVGGKLSTVALREMYGDNPASLWRYLATNMVTADKTTGLHPNVVADMFGFPNGDALVREIVDAFPEEQTIDGMTEQRLLETYGEAVTADGMEKAATEAIHNEARARAVATEIATMRKAMGQREGKVNVMMKAARSFAEQLVARRKIKDLKTSVFTGAEARAGKKAQRAMAAGDQQAAVSAKRDQLLNHYAAKNTMAALKEVERGLAYLKKFDKDTVRKNVDNGYLDQIDQLLERFDLRVSVTQRDLAKRASLREWLESQREIGLDPMISRAIENEAYTTSYKEMPLEEFRGLVDTVKNIEHLGRLKEKLLRAKDERDFTTIVDEITATIYESTDKRRDDRLNAPTTKDRAVDLARNFFSMHRKLASLIRQLDGFKDGGPLWRAFGRSMNEAADSEQTMIDKSNRALADIFKPMIEGGKLRERLKVPGIRETLTLETRLAVALNWGNDTNRQRVLEGDGWSQGQVEAILSSLTNAQLDFVQKVWDHIDSFWPAIKAKEERLSGTVPDKVEASSFVVTVDGQQRTMRGGYYPIKYDTARSDKAGQLDAAAVAQQMKLGVFSRSSTRRGHLEERAAGGLGPVRKDIGVVFEHVNQVVHDLAWHEWLIDANRIVRDPRVRAAIRSTLGPEVLEEFVQTLPDIAAGDVPAASAFERGISHLRNGTTVVGMGWNLVTAMMQPLGLSQSMVRIGPKWVAKGMGRWIGDAAKMESSAKWMHERSEFMRQRSVNLNREVRDLRGKLTGSMPSVMQDSYFWFIMKGQIVADLPTWFGQYEKTMAESNGDEQLAFDMADQAVRDSQGGGTISDLARIQRGGPLQKLFTNFYSYFSTTFNLLAERSARTSMKDPLSVAHWISDFLLLAVVPSVMVTLLKAAVNAAMGGEEDEDELLEKIIRDQIGFLMGTMVGLRELSAAANGFFGYSGPAGTRFFSEFAKLGKQIEQGEADMPLMKALNNSLGILFHYPAGAINRFVEGAVALNEGETTNPAAVVFGPPRD